MSNSESDSETYNNNFRRRNTSEIIKFCVQSDLYCDLTILTDDRSFKAHKNVLCGHSGYFKCLLDEVPKVNEVQIDFVDSDILKIIIEYVYTGNIEFNVDNVLRILKGAKKLQIIALVDACKNYTNKFIENHEYFEARLLEEEEEESQEIEEQENEVDVEDEEDDDEEVEDEEDEDGKVEDAEDEDGKVEDEEDEGGNEEDERDNEEEDNETISINNHILVFSGKNYPISSYIDIYDPNTDTWLERKRTKIETTDFATIKIRNQLITFGGKKGAEAVDEVNAIDLKALTIETKTPMQYKRSNCCAVKLPDNNRIYVIGGKDGSNYLRSVEWCDYELTQWIDAPSMEISRCNFAVEVVGDDIYVVGGLHENGALNEVEVFSIQKNEWTTLSPMKKSRYYAGLISSANGLFVFGGCNDYGDVSSIEFYDFESESWTELDCENFPDNLSHTSVARLDEDNFIVVGGRQVFRYNCLDNDWRELSSLSATRLGIHIWSGTLED